MQEPHGSPSLWVCLQILCSLETSILWYDWSCFANKGPLPLGTYLEKQSTGWVTVPMASLMGTHVQTPMAQLCLLTSSCWFVRSAVGFLGVESVLEMTSTPRVWVWSHRELFFICHLLIVLELNLQGKILTLGKWKNSKSKHQLGSQIWQWL